MSRKFVIAGTSAVYHIAMPDGSALCTRTVYTPTITGEIPTKKRLCANCADRVGYLVDASQKEKQQVAEKKRVRNTNRLNILAKGRAYIIYDANNNIGIFSNFPEFSHRAIQWAKDYHERKPYKYKELLCIDQFMPFHAELHYKGSQKVYTILLPGRDEYYNAKEWKALSQLVFERDGHICRVCGSTIYKLVAHHITYDRFGNEELADLTTLCRHCHKLFHQHGKIHHD